MKDHGYGYWPGDVIVTGGIGPRGEFGKTTFMLPVPCRACGGEHEPIVEERAPMLSDHEYFVIRAGECPEVDENAEEINVVKIKTPELV